MPRAKYQTTNVFFAPADRADKMIWVRAVLGTAPAKMSGWGLGPLTASDQKARMHISIQNAIHDDDHKRNYWMCN